jgi:ribosomal 30S subunit maturation factor RimM
MVEDAVEETQIGEAESSVDEIQFVEVGYICNVHSLRGEVCVKPATDFPEEHFLKVLNAPNVL